MSDSLVVRPRIRNHCIKPTHMQRVLKTNIKKKEGETISKLQGPCFDLRAAQQRHTSVCGPCRLEFILIKIIELESFSPRIILPIPEQHKLVNGKASGRWSATETVFKGGRGGCQQ